jgi:hypothetical protein
MAFPVLEHSTDVKIKEDAPRRESDAELDGRTVPHRVPQRRGAFLRPPNLAVSLHICPSARVGAALVLPVDHQTGVMAFFQLVEPDAGRVHANAS